MNDQAQALRDMLQNGRPPETSTRTTRIITITSGKGGVGKSNFTLNFALSLQMMGYRVLVFDADIGLANIEVLMGISPQYTLYHLLKGQKTIWEILYKGHNDLLVVSGGSGFNELQTLSDDEMQRFTEQLNELNGYVDYILFDTGAGISKDTLKFIVAANETIVITTPEPTAITDAYATIKMVRNLQYDRFRLVVNRIADLKEGKRTSEKITLVAKRFLNMNIQTLGYLVEDANVTKAVKKQIPYLLAYPGSAASLGIREIAEGFVSGQPEAYANGGVRAFLNRLIQLLR